MNKLTFLLLATVIVLTLFNQSTHAIVFSSESIQAKAAIDNSTADIVSMQEKGIPTSRVNESLHQAIQLYNAQLALEGQGKMADYKLVLSYSDNVAQLKASSFKALDELIIFNETYDAAKKDSNLSAMDPEYTAIQKSFADERFEDTIPLIEKGYQKLSEIQSSQTTVKLFYDTTSRTLKTFLTDNAILFVSPQFYRSLYFYIIAIIILAIIFWKTIKRIRIKMQIKDLMIRKDSIYDLIKKLQSDYFKTKKISETEYFSKIEKFKDMIRDIDRKIPLLKEELIRVDKNKLKLSMNEEYKIKTKSKK